ncbi:Mpo1 family 2-hydroxy fatty acid dioxygenase [Acinetobacter sp. WZC-1]|uniref:Mpo1 family 2-hydroxy fatty acid dioxygenase n=1 Tax=Acinetobacter sp. WZC-1 TaxID=3459034 RepID=UPI00403DAD52
MTRLEQVLSKYAAYHLDHKNIVTHFIGVPVIVFSILCLTARAGFMVSGFDVTLAMVLIVISGIYYLNLDRIFGGILTLLLAVAYPFAWQIAQMDTMSWLAISVGIFVFGWVFQFIGHYYEKKKPAFVDDLQGLIIGPLFVLAELIFLLGFRKELQSIMLNEARKQRAEMNAKSTHATIG